MMRFLLLVASVAFAAGAGFSYNRCAADGPYSWAAEFCKGTSNSPIDVCGAEYSSSLPRLEPNQLCATRELDIKNNGHTLQINMIRHQPTLIAEDLEYMVRPYLQPSPGAKKRHMWQLEQVHFHWGRTGKDTEGSEHFLNGKQYALEAHFVHFNKKYGDSVGEAVGTGRADALLVAGVFFDLDSDYPDEPAALTAIANAASAATELNKFYRMNDTVQLSTIWDGTGYYYTYAGGLTTPTCNEVVTWVVMEDVKKVTQETLNKIKAAKVPPSAATHGSHFATQAHHEELIAEYGNYRPLQPKGDRKVYTSNPAVINATCNTPPEAIHACASTSCPTVTGKSCMFPFRYKGTVYKQCITRDNGNTPWCPTELTDNGDWIQGKIESCNQRLCSWTGQTAVDTAAAPSPVGAYSQGVIYGGPMVFVSGQGPVSADSQQVVGVTVAEQMKQALKSLEAVLVAAGSSKKHVLKTTVMLTDMATMTEADVEYANFFGVHKPANSYYTVKSLPNGALVQIDATAGTTR